MPDSTVSLPDQVVLGDKLGGRSDSIELTIADKTVRFYEDYDIKMSILQQPAAFSLRLGWSDIAKDLLNSAVPGLPFQLWIDNRVVQTGVVDARRLAQKDGGTFVEVRGRDALAPLYDSYVDEERSFADKTYYDLTRTILDIVGLKEPDHGLVVYNGADAAAYKKAITGTQVLKVVNEELIRDIETGAAEASTTTKVVNKTLKAKLGERWFDWLHRQYKLVGLFLWCTGEGNFVLGQPDWQQDPAFTILKSRGIDQEFATVLETDWDDDTTGRHSEIVVHGRASGGAAGRSKIVGRHIDDEMVKRGFAKRLVVHDDDCKSASDAAFVARRMGAEERRNGWTLKYTVSGHTMPSITGGGTAIWGPDMMCRVSDDEIPVDGTLYIESVQFSRRPQTTTTLTLMRPEDLIFAKPELANKKAPKLRKQPKG